MAVAMEQYSNKSVERLNEEATADLKKYYGHLKYLPLFFVCAILGGAAVHVFGFWPALPIFIVAGLFKGGHVKGIPKVLGALFLAFLLPPIIAVLTGH